MRSIHRTREMMGENFLEMTLPYFNGTEVRFRAIAALLVGGIYYTILHTRHNGTMFTNVNLSTNTGNEKMLTAIDQILDFVFEHTNKNHIAGK